MLHHLAAYFGYYADNFLHLCTETHESHTCLTLAKNSSIMENLFLMVALKSIKLHLLSVTSWVE